MTGWQGRAQAPSGAKHANTPCSVPKWQKPVIPGIGLVAATPTLSDAAAAPSAERSVFEYCVVNVYV
ncbi:hypothetical protein N7492_003066 [Penicillium capsulatum]|uniref:Uncharacterized protein n=1 Tax=Penicillium capsulatum TaxID=69766 RepID=A0A9W9IMH0_9EURO|nr:hypothetical protein N7492_003066 [Penicillium capsulatum]KAJ6122342.1 hypothetical protein N7512_004807 [Penicillium capsulatum]